MNAAIMNAMNGPGIITGGINSTELKSKSDIFWEFIEESLLITIPANLKYILKCQNLDGIMIGRVQEKDFAEIEEFVRSDVYKSQLPNKHSNLSLYYGAYATYPAKFKFTVGEKQMILVIAQFVLKIDIGTWKKLFSDKLKELTAK